MKKSATALIALLSMACISPVHAEQYPQPEHAEESCPVVPPVIQTVYVDRTVYVPQPGPTVYVPQPAPTVYVPQPAPTVYVTQPPIVVTRSVPVIAPQIPVDRPRAHEIIHTVYRTQYVSTDKIETIVALAKSQYQANAYKQAYLAMRAKFLALVKVEKKEK